jgi:hypothetical protein
MMGSAALMSGIERYKFGWISPATFDSTSFAGDTTIVLHDCATNGEDGYAILRTHDVNQYFILEARNDKAPYCVRQPVDSTMPDCCKIGGMVPGLLVTHVFEGGIPQWIPAHIPPVWDAEFMGGMFDTTSGAPDPISGRDTLSAYPNTNIDPQTQFLAGPGSSYGSNVFGPFTNPNSNLYAGQFDADQDVYGGWTVFNVDWAGPGTDSIQVSLRYEGSTAPAGADTLRADMAWEGTVQLTGDLVVPAGRTLTVGQGTAVYAAALKDRHAGGKHTSRVEVIVADGGVLNVQGQPGEEAVFSSSRDPAFDHFRGPEAGSPASGDWRGFRTLNSAPMGYGYDCNGTIAEATVSYADKAIAMEDNCAPSISGVRFLYNNIDIFADSTDVFVSNLNPWNLEAPVLAVFTNATRSGQDFSPGHAGVSDFIVQGLFNTTGTSADSVRFRPEFPNNATGDEFGGIYMDRWSAGSQVEYMEISHAANPIFFYYPDGSALRHSTIHHFNDLGAWVFEAFGSGMVVDSNLVQRDDTTTAGDDLLAEHGNTGILIEKSGPISVRGNRVILKGVGTTSTSGAGIEIRNTLHWCLYGPITPDSVRIVQNRIIGPGKGQFHQFWSGIEFDRACGPVARMVYAAENHVTEWNNAGLYFAQASDVQVSCNIISSNRRGVDFTRTESQGDAVRFKRNTIEKGTGTVPVIRTDRADLLVLGADTTTTTDNLVKTNTAIQKFIHENDADDGHTLYAVQNQWYISNAFSSDTTQIKLRIGKDAGASGNVLLSISPVKTSASTPSCSVPALALVGPETGAAPEDAPRAMEGPRTSLIPERTGFEKVGPSPFRTGTTVDLAVAEQTSVSVRIYDVQGRVVRELAEGVLQAGRYRIYWDGRSGSGARVASGTYFVRLQAGELRQVHKLVRVE